MKLEIPSRETQNKWLTDYVVPLIDLDFGKVAKNYKDNKRMAHLRGLWESGVAQSLQKMGVRGRTPIEEILVGMRKGIDAVKVRNDYIASNKLWIDSYFKLNFDKYEKHADYAYLAREKQLARGPAV